MSKKKKRQKRSSESKTCFIFAAAFLVCGLACIIYGKKFYHSDKMVSENEIITGQTATVTSVEKRDRTLTNSEKEQLKKDGYSDDEIRWEYYVQYSIMIDGTEYTYDDVRPYYDDGKFTPREGDTDIVNCAIKNGELIVSPETGGTNSAVISGWILAILGVIALGIGFFIRK